MRRTQLIITTAVLVAACAVPATAAAHYGQDLRSPDTRDAAAAAAGQPGEYMYSSDPASAQARVQGHAPDTQVAQDLRSPDARDAVSTPDTQVTQDLRSPDARDAGRPPVEVAQDLRSPDARDAGRPPVQVATPVVEIPEATGNGFDWGDAGIGAVGMLALFSIAGGVALMVGSRRRRGLGMPAH
jgi:hypothetical protein